MNLTDYIHSNNIQEIRRGMTVFIDYKHPITGRVEKFSVMLEGSNGKTAKIRILGYCGMILVEQGKTLDLSHEKTQIMILKVKADAVVISYLQDNKQA